MFVSSDYLEYNHVWSTSPTVSRDYWKILFKVRGDGKEEGKDEGKNIRIAEE
jgi:hypothetical protein